MNEKQPSNPLDGVRVLTDKQTLKKDYPCLSIVVKAIMWMALGGLIVYEWEPIWKVFQKVLSMFSNLF